MNQDDRERGAARRDRRSLAQVQAFDALLEGAVRERASGAPAEEFSGRLLAQMTSMPQARVERWAGPRLLWSLGVSGLVAAAVVVVVSFGHVRRGAPVFPRNGAGSAARVSAPPVSGKGRKPVLQAGMSVVRNVHALRVHAQLHALVTANVENSAVTREDAMPPKLETFPARTPSVAERKHSTAVPDAPATQVVIVAGPSFDTAELHIEPIPTEALPSHKDPE